MRKRFCLIFIALLALVLTVSCEAELGHAAELIDVTIAAGFGEGKSLTFSDKTADWFEYSITPEYSKGETPYGAVSNQKLTLGNNGVFEINRKLSQGLWTLTVRAYSSSMVNDEQTKGALVVTGSKTFYVGKGIGNLSVVLDTYVPETGTLSLVDIALPQLAKAVDQVKLRVTIDPDTDNEVTYTIEGEKASTWSENNQGMRYNGTLDVASGVHVVKLEIADVVERKILGTVINTISIVQGEISSITGSMCPWESVPVVSASGVGSSFAIKGDLKAYNGTTEIGASDFSRGAVNLDRISKGTTVRLEWETTSGDAPTSVEFYANGSKLSGTVTYTRNSGKITKATLNYTVPSNATSGYLYFTAVGKATIDDKLRLGSASVDQRIIVI